MAEYTHTIEFPITEALLAANAPDSLGQEVLDGKGNTFLVCLVGGVSNIDTIVGGMVGRVTSSIVTHTVTGDVSQTTSNDITGVTFVIASAGQYVHVMTHGNPADYTSLLRTDGNVAANEQLTISATDNAFGGRLITATSTTFTNGIGSSQIADTSNQVATTACRIFRT